MASPPIKIAIINPNSSQPMTDSLKPVIESLGYNNTLYTYHTAPAPSPPSINNPTDALLSSTTLLNSPAFPPLLQQNDAFLIACFSPHPLVAEIKRLVPGKAVVGIFEAACEAAVNLLVPGGRGGDGGGTNREEDDIGREGRGSTFGIVTTGESWKLPLSDAVIHSVLGRDIAAQLFAGVECVGLTAAEVHSGVGVEEKVKAATRRLGERGGVGAVVLGCAGFVGMEGWVREASAEGTRVVDGVKAGVGVLQGLVRMSA